MSLEHLRKWSILLRKGFRRQYIDDQQNEYFVQNGFTVVLASDGCCTVHGLGLRGERSAQSWRNSNLRPRGR